MHLEASKSLKYSIARKLTEAGNLFSLEWTCCSLVFSGALHRLVAQEAEVVSGATVTVMAAGAAE